MSIEKILFRFKRKTAYCYAVFLLGSTTNQVFQLGRVADMSTLRIATYQYLTLKELWLSIVGVCVVLLVDPGGIEPQTRGGNPLCRPATQGPPISIPTYPESCGKSLK